MFRSLFPLPEIELTRFRFFLGLLEINISEVVFLESAAIERIYRGVCVCKGGQEGEGEGTVAGKFS